jgi:hypothetical protein
MLSMLYLLLCCLITLELVGDDDPWYETLFLEEFAKEPRCCLGISLSLQQDIQHVPG